LHEHWLEIWLLAALAATGVGSALLVRESSLRGLRLIGTPIRKFALCLVPSLCGRLDHDAVDWFVRQPARHSWQLAAVSTDVR